jgi:hypothetical protein
MVIVTVLAAARMGLALLLMPACTGLCATAPAAAAAEPTRVLVINSFSVEDAPYNVFASLFRAELA